MLGGKEQALNPKQAGVYSSSFTLGLFISIALIGIICALLGGMLGYKKGFHQGSIQLGSQLIDKIKAIDPENIVTDCLSCRLQFNQLTSYKVFHPIEILRKAYAGYQKSVKP